MNELIWILIATTVLIILIMFIGFSWVFEALDEIKDILWRKEKVKDN